MSAGNIKNNEGQCRFTREPMKECYCSDMGSQKIQASLDYCGGAYEECEIYKKMKNTEHVLIIDDEPQFRYGIANALGKAGYKTSEAVSGEEALKILHSSKERRFDLLLINIQMPGLSGIELIDKLNRDGIYLPMIALSKSGGKGLVAELLHRGCADFIYKPVESAELVKRVGHIFNKR